MANTSDEPQLMTPGLRTNTAFDVRPQQRSSDKPCEEVGVVNGVHLLSGEVRSVTTALKVVQEVQEEEQEIKYE